MKLHLPSNRSIDISVPDARPGKRAREGTDATDEPVAKSPRPETGEELNDNDIDALFEDDPAEIKDCNASDDYSLFGDDIGEAQGQTNDDSIFASILQDINHHGDSEDSDVSLREDVLMVEPEQIKVLRPSITPQDDHPQSETIVDENIRIERDESQSLEDELRAALFPENQRPDTTPVVDAPENEITAYGNVRSPGPADSQRDSGSWPEPAPDSGPEFSDPASTRPLTPGRGSSAQDVSATKTPGPGRPRVAHKRDEIEPKRPRGRPRKDPIQEPSSTHAPTKGTLPKTRVQAPLHPYPTPVAQYIKPIEIVRAPARPQRRPSDEDPQFTFQLITWGDERIFISKKALCRHSAVIRDACHTDGMIHWPIDGEAICDFLPLLAELLYSPDDFVMQDLCTPAVWQAVADLVHDDEHGRLEEPNVDVFIVLKGHPALLFFFGSQVYKLLDTLGIKTIARKVYLDTIRPAWQAYRAHFPVPDSSAYEQQVLQMVESRYWNITEDHRKSWSHRIYDWAQDGLPARNLWQLATRTRTSE